METKKFDWRSSILDEPEPAAIMTSDFNGGYELDREQVLRWMAENPNETMRLWLTVWPTGGFF